MALRGRLQIPAKDFPHFRGVPLGGIGAGSIELGHDGCFRNITINNNRTTLDRIAWSPHSFVAIRVATNEGASPVLLQRRKALPAGAVKTVALQADQYVWRAQYPRADFQINGSVNGVQVNWGYYSPLIPYDYEASTLPAILFEANFVNTLSTAATVSTLFNWENLTGCSASRRPETPRPIVPVQTWRKVEATISEGPLDASRTGNEDNGGGEVLDLFALRFGVPHMGRNNFDGEHVLSVLGMPDSECSHVIWDPEAESDAQAFWSAFESEGALPNQTLNPRHAAGAICVRTTLKPKERTRVTFALTWCCPRFEVGGIDQGNGYTNTFTDALLAASRCLNHTSYYLSSIRKWHHQLVDTSLPEWLARALLNNCAVFSSNTLYNREGRYALFDSPLSPEAGASDHRLISSLGSLLFFPRFELAELLQTAKLEDPALPNHISRRLGYLCFHEPDFQGSRISQAELCAILVLSAYRDLVLTGNRARLSEAYPRLRKLVDAVLRYDRDTDGLPEMALGRQTLDGIPIPGLSSMAASVWTAALRAFSRFCKLQNDEELAKKYQDISLIAAESFERNYWDAELGYYRLFRDFSTAPEEKTSLAMMCHLTQLTGQWYADFLGLGTLFNRAHVSQALDSIWNRNRRPRGVAMCTWPTELPRPEELDTLGDALDSASPAYTIACYAALLVSRGQAARGLMIAEQCIRQLDDARGMRFELHYRAYHTQEGRHPDSAERHISALAIWHVYYALAGVQMNMAENSIIIDPKLPLEDGSCRISLFTPVGFGQLSFDTDYGEVIRRRIRLRFESPMTIERIITPMPADVEQFRVECETAFGPVEQSFRLIRIESTRWIVIDPHKPLTGVNNLQVTIQEDEDAALPEAPDMW